MKALPKALLLLSIATAMATGAAAGADDRYSNDVNAGVRVNANVQAPRLTFSHPPQWRQVSGTPVYMVHDEDRPDFDMFRYGGNYYLYDDGNWFRADRWNGRYQRFDERDVPTALARVPEIEWRSYPGAWANRYSGSNTGQGNRDWNDRYGYSDDRDRNRSLDERRMNAPDPRADFRSTPRWRQVPGTQVQMVPDARNAGYDMFRAGSSYYIYGDNGQWYRSNRWDGQYQWLDSRDVPMTIARVPEREWRSYPSEWANRDTRINDPSSRTRLEDRNARDNRYLRDYRYAPPAPRITMRTAPSWRRLPGTAVYVATNNQADFDLFRVGNTFYLYNNGYWYRSNQWNGTFTSTDQARVPREFQRVPGSAWRHGPPSWANSRSNFERDYSSVQRQQWEESRRNR